MFQTFFGLTLPVTDFPVAAEQANALADRINATALQVREDAPAAFAAEARRDAERYLAARRGGLKLPVMVGRACDEGARGLMRLTVSTPPLPTYGERLVA
jgi:hypothetical protein